MRISDWSSDVCSSDLGIGTRLVIFGQVGRHLDRRIDDDIFGKLCRQRRLDAPRQFLAAARDVEDARREIHRPAEQPGEGQYRHMLGRVGRIAPGVELLPARALAADPVRRSEEHTSELQSLMRISYAVFCLKKTQT